jgi:hypothetical protein
MNPKNEASQPARKRPYRVPTLTVHGDLKALAKGTGKDGTSHDGGKPGTRAGGPPG